jgi:hypothetical protein
MVPVGNPVIVVPGLIPTSPVIMVEPLLVMEVLDTTVKFWSVPRFTALVLSACTNQVEAVPIESATKPIAILRECFIYILVNDSISRLGNRLQIDKTMQRQIKMSPDLFIAIEEKGTKLKFSPTPNQRSMINDA